MRCQCDRIYIAERLPDGSYSKLCSLCWGDTKQIMNDPNRMRDYAFVRLTSGVTETATESDNL